MESTMVIKVKYGDTLRRFNVSVDENEKLDLDIDGLRAKILDLFNFPPDADLRLTYIDEDGDIVTLVDDNDLLDVMKQRLKFLRIDVQLKNEKSGKNTIPQIGSVPSGSSNVSFVPNGTNILATFGRNETKNIVPQYSDMTPVSAAPIISADTTRPFDVDQPHAMGLGGGTPVVNNSTGTYRHRRISQLNMIREAMVGTFHRSIVCDGCGAHPITGPRFKSKVKDDYDLCSICFATMGNENDYIRLDKPVYYRLRRP